MSERKTIIWVSETVWKWLQTRKEIGDSFDSLLIRLLNIKTESDINNSEEVKENL